MPSRLPLNRAVAGVSVILLAVIGVVAYNGSSDTPKPVVVNAPVATQAPQSGKPLEKLNIFDSVVGAGSFTTLTRLLSETDLAVTLKGPGPFTLFAPTDDAFNALPDGKLAEFEADKAKLTKLLSYHVLGSKLPVGNVTGTDLATLEGATVNVHVKDGVLSVNDATAIAVDLEATNGLIQIMDRVLIPPSR